MRKILFAALVAAIPAGAFAQSAVSAYQLSQTDLRGTARFVGMAGAFGALGGDLSTLNQNPAGIGVYRSSDIGVTINIDAMSSNVDGVKMDKTNVYCPNVGYIGSMKTGLDAMPYFQWGFSYGRVVSLDRCFSGGYGSLGTSLSNYIANFTNGYSYEKLGQSNSFNPYNQTNYDWLSILGYNGYIVNPIGETDRYNGLYDEDHTYGNSQYTVRQKGFIDEYSINFGGNIMNTVYWGIGFGITDISLTEDVFYDEELSAARIPLTESTTPATGSGNGYFGLSNYRHVDGSGFNFKIGAIVKPINELRFGFAVHTPTYYSLSETYDAALDYSFSTPSTIPNGTAYTDYAYFDWKLQTPWKLMLSGATVIGGRFIFSADYEADFYKDMVVEDYYGQEDNLVADDIDFYYKTASTLRLGAEFRVTPQFSVRAGFANTWSGVKESVNIGDYEVYTSGTDPSYTFDTNTRYLTLGLGYRYKAFYADAAYVNKYRKSTYHPFTSYQDEIGWMYAPISDFTTTNNQVVLSLGFKF